MGCDSDSVNHRDKFRGGQGHCGLGQQKPVSHMKVFSGRSLGESEHEAGHAAGLALPRRPGGAGTAPRHQGQSPDEEYSDVHRRKRDGK